MDDHSRTDVVTCLFVKVFWSDCGPLLLIKASKGRTAGECKIGCSSQVPMLFSMTMLGDCFLACGFVSIHFSAEL